MQDLSSKTRDRTCAPCRGRDHQRSPMTSSHSCPRIRAVSDTAVLILGSFLEDEGRWKGRGRTWAERGAHPTQWHPGACLDLTVPSRFDQRVIPPASRQRSSLLMSACLDMFHFLTVSSGGRKEHGWKGIHQPLFPTEVWPHVELLRGRERGSIKWGCVEDPGRRDRASTPPLSPLPPLTPPNVLNW